MKHISTYLVLALLTISCNQSKLPPIAPDVITETTLNDTDDPAIWINPKDASKSIVFGTDKETNGAVYAFDLDGKIIEEKTIRNLQRPNNVDVEYGFQLNDSVAVDILAFTEREKQQIRLFSVPDMKPLDGGGFPVFEDEDVFEQKLPMGIGLYKSPLDTSIYAIVGRKTGPSDNYLYQYKLVVDSSEVKIDLVRKFGKFSGEKEIEAIAVDDEMGFVYYSDEGVCIRKYHAEPKKGNEELSCFGTEHFLRDIEGIAIATYPNEEGFIIVSDQQRGQFNIFSRKRNAFIKAVNLTTLETDGCEVVTVPLNDTFPNGLFAAMNDEKNFYFYDLEKVLE
ncbi:3-phytase [Flagellimonas aquimarina]|uniref:3-phytase n=1 Tax=Flagellimonas aquimarina TaxID=2201895 RepID=A0A316L776_9FLAO|nr:phytase [Allomuricauda koreensis]PWL40163.1 3-phytase [Allomuricauda koreensis]